MKVFLIIPPVLHYMEPYSYVKADRNNYIRPYLGLLYIAASLRKDTGIDSRIIDSNMDRLSLADLKNILIEEQPDLVGFSVLTFNLLNCIEVAKVVREVSAGTKICFGGWHPTLYPEETLKLDCVDYVAIGEGEKTFSELVTACNNNHNNKLEGIKGIGYKTTDGHVVINAPRELIKDLDELPLPAYDIIDIQKYSNLLARTKNSINIITSRGCPHRCIFCDLRRAPYRFRSPGNVVKEIQFWTQRGFEDFFIQDDNFTINRKRTIEFCDLLIDSGLRIKYKISSRVDYLDDEVLGCLKKSGCYCIYFGIESGVQKMLDYLEKGITIEQIKRAFELCKKHRIDRAAYIMIGMPEETRDDIETTLSLVKEIKPQYLHCSVCTPMPKTLFYQKLLSQGFIKRDYWRDFAVHPDPKFKTPFCSLLFSDEELRSIQNSIQRKFYLNPKVVFHEMIKIREMKQFIAKAKLAFKFFLTN